MFVLQTNVGALFRVVAMLVSVAMLMWSVGSWTQAEAANVLEFTDLLSDSSPSAGSNHTVSFRAPSQDLVATDVITLTFPTSPDAFDLSTIGEEDIDVYDGTGYIAEADFSVATTATEIAITLSGAVNIASTATTSILIGTHATNDAGTPDSQIVNPATSNTSYEITVVAEGDSGATRVAIVDTVTVTASVDTQFDFTVTGVSTSTSVNGTSTTGTTDATNIPFGDLNSGSIETLAQRLNVETNARNGFVVTVEQDGNLRSVTGADIDGFIDGVYTDSPTAWAGPTPNVNDENTWGHWGLNSMDDLNANEFGTGGWVAASTTPREIFAHDGPADNVTNSIGSTTVAYQVEITALQEAADDYSTTLMYIATPTF